MTCNLKNSDGRKRTSRALLSARIVQGSDIEQRSRKNRRHLTRQLLRSLHTIIFPQWLYGH